jgi:hypothetical protein
VVAVVEDLVFDIGQVGGDVGRVGAVARVGLEELVPEENAVLIGQVVKIGVCAVADPVADDNEAGEGVHVELGVETLAGNALHGFVETPVATARHDADTVDREGEVFGVGDGVSDLAVAEVSGLFVGGDPSLSGLEGEGELVEVLRAIAVGPPEFGVDDVEFGGGGGFEGGLGGGVRREADGLAKGYSSCFP